VSGICNAHKHYEPGCRQCEMDNEPMEVASFECPKCRETFEDLYYTASTVMECPFCDDVVMEKK